MTEWFNGVGSFKTCSRRALFLLSQLTQLIRGVIAYPWRFDQMTHIVHNAKLQNLLEQDTCCCVED
jgi:hypothetical protein